MSVSTSRWLTSVFPPTTAGGLRGVGGEGGVQEPRGDAQLHRPHQPLVERAGARPPGAAGRRAPRCARWRGWRSGCPGARRGAGEVDHRAVARDLDARRGAPSRRPAAPRASKRFAGKGPERLAHPPLGAGLERAHEVPDRLRRRARGRAPPAAQRRGGSPPRCARRSARLSSTEREGWGPSREQRRISSQRPSPRSQQVGGGDHHALLGERGRGAAASSPAASRRSPRGGPGWPRSPAASRPRRRPG